MTPPCKELRRSDCLGGVPRRGAPPGLWPGVPKARILALGRKKVRTRNPIRPNANDVKQRAPHEMTKKRKSSQVKAESPLTPASADDDEDSAVISFLPFPKMCL